MSGDVMEIVVESIGLVLDLLAIVGASVILLCYFLFSEIRTGLSRLVVALCVADVLLNLAFIFQFLFANNGLKDLTDITWLCVPLAFLTNTMLFVQLFWGVSISFHLFLIHVMHVKSTNSLGVHIVNYIICWAIPFLISLVMLFFPGLFGKTPYGRCLISHDYRLVTGISLVGVWSVYIVVIFQFGTAGIVLLYRIFTKQINSRDLYQVRTGLIYIVVFLSTWISPTFLALFDIFTLEPAPFVIWMLPQLFGPHINGIIVFIVFTITQKGVFPDSLATVMENPISLKHFIHYMMDDFSAENIFFFLEIERYHSNHEQIEKLRQKISNTNNNGSRSARLAENTPRLDLFENSAEFDSKDTSKETKLMRREKEMSRHCIDLACAIFSRYIDPNLKHPSATQQQLYSSIFSSMGFTSGSLELNISDEIKLIIKHRYNEYLDANSDILDIDLVNSGSMSSAGFPPSSSSADVLPPKDLFDAAQQFVIASLNNDIFPRFQKSQHYQLMIQQLREEESSTRQLLIVQIAIKFARLCGMRRSKQLLQMEQDRLTKIRIRDPEVLSRLDADIRDHCRRVAQGRRKVAARYETTASGIFGVGGWGGLSHRFSRNPLTPLAGQDPETFPQGSTSLLASEGGENSTMETEITTVDQFDHDAAEIITTPPPLSTSAPTTKMTTTTTAAPISSPSVDDHYVLFESNQ